MSVVIITGNKYPCGDAGAIRQHAMAKILKSLGHDVLVLGYGKVDKKSTKEYDGIQFESFRPRSANLIIRGIYRYSFVDRVAMYVNRRFKGKNIDWILVIDVYPRDYKTISKIAHRYKAGLIHDSVEWYSPEEFSNGVKNISYRNKEYTNTVAINKDWRVIAISAYLDEYFSKRCERTVRIPVIMDVGSIACNLNPIKLDKVCFCYAGAPGRKDYLKEIVEGFCLLSRETLSNVELNIVGVNFQQLQDICGIPKETLDKLEGVLIAHGRLPHDEAVRFVREADYTLLIRDASLRYAKAGFPTKIVESLACGTPPVCNLSSDLGMYLRHRENAILADGHAPEQIKVALEAAILMPSEERKKMRRNARDTAEKCFDYRQYIAEMDKLLK